MPDVGPEFRTIDAGRAKLRVAVEGEGPLVLMVHGFPESWYSWRHQIGPIAQAGFTAAAIDVRGSVSYTHLTLPTNREV